MGKFKVGDRVLSDDGHKAIVIGVTDTIAVQWIEYEGVTGTWPAYQFDFVPRKFKPGNFVRSVADDNTFGTVGMVFDDDGDPEDQDPYWVALYDVEQSEEPFSAYELIPWVPKIGERVIEANNEPEEDDEGTVVECDGINVRILWDAFPHVQGGWEVADLEPVDEEQGFAVGDEVIYTNQIFAHPLHAVVLEVRDRGLKVTGQIDGTYSKDFFSKAA
jgi:hypothetical protein